MSSFHTSVLLQEVLDGLRVEKDTKYIDATLGGGGHSFEILKRGGRVLGIDVDQEAIDYVGGRWRAEALRLGIEEKNLTLAKGNFREIDRIARLKKFEKVKGIIFDLGVSSHQLEFAERGFSFQQAGPLDMRMDQELGVKAKDLLHALTKEELYELFTKFGEEKNAWIIADHIVKARGVMPFSTTEDLVKAIGMNKAASGIHRATRVFQALRIAVNDELNSLQEALPKAVEILEENGRLLVISFHSLEDRIVKNMFLGFKSKGIGEIVTKKPIIPTDKEININKRARSAKLRIFNKI